MKTVVFVAAALLISASSAMPKLHAQAESETVDGGTLSWTSTYNQQGSCPQQPNGPTSPIYTWQASNFSYRGATTTALGGSTVYLVSPGGPYCPPSGVQSGNPQELGVAEGITFYGIAENGPGVNISTTQTSVLDPAYKVTSIIYDAPGNRSSVGFSNTTTDGTTSTLGNSFQNSSTITLTEGFKAFGFASTASQSFGVSTTTTSSTAFQDTFSDATGVANQTASTASNAVNHNQDLFLIWLNPEVNVQLNGSVPTSYAVGLQPVLAGSGSPTPDILEVPANVMQANASGVTTVPAALLNPQMQPSATNGAQVQEPGLAGMCKHVNLSEYLASGCTLTDQCGCTPSDFAPILALDPLLNVSGTTSPLSVDASGASSCQSPTTSTNCRYIPVPITKGSSTPATASLQGPASAGGNTTANTFTQTDASTTTQTQGGTLAQSVGASFHTGSPVFSLTVADQLTFSESQSTATASGQANSQTITLGSSTVGCSETVAIYEDTVFHTFVIQQPVGNYGCQ